METKQELTDIAEIQFMELPALRRYIQENETSIKDAIGENKLLEWLLFIDDPESELAKMAEEKNELIGRARDMLKTLSKDEKLQEEYMAREKALMDKYSALSEAEERGKIEVAINFYKMGLTIDQIAQGTRLDKEKLKEILKDVER
jgi:predicted transposase/invertase (TIGR01784 family)